MEVKENKISEIIDFTDKLKEFDGSYCFNPSIAHWKDNLYLICYRKYLTIDPLYSKNTASIHNRANFYHPWGGKWKVGEGYDKTGFAIFKIDNKSITLFKSLNDGNSIYYFDEKENLFNKSEDKYMVGTDARLIKKENNEFIISYNTFDHYDIDIKNGENCKSGCTLIITRIIKLDEYGNLLMYKDTPLCPEISNSTEKNWSFFKYNKKILFSYGLTPTHLIYSVSANENVKCGKLEFQDDIKYYGNYEKNVNPKKGKKLLNVSVSTPAIPSRNFPDRFIAVGHVKYKYNKLKKFSSPSLNGFINVFLDEKKRKKNELKKKIEETEFLLDNLKGNKAEKNKEIKQTLEKYENEYNDKYSTSYEKTTYKRHEYLDYLMFIYEFDARNGKITRISDMFIPENSEYLLVFPTGLIYIENELWIFYGDHDSNCKIMTINNEYVLKILKEVPKDTDAFSSSDINYFTFPEKCIKKSSICDILLSI